MVLMQAIAQDCFELLRVAAAALRQWSVDVSRAIQQQPLTDSKQHSAKAPKSTNELDATSDWLLIVVKDLVHTMWQQELCILVDQPLLLDTLGQLVRRVRRCSHNIVSCLLPPVLTLRAQAASDMHVWGTPLDWPCMVASPV